MVTLSRYEHTAVALPTGSLGLQKKDTISGTIQVLSVHYDCDKDAIIYLSEPTGPSCHTGSATCWFQAVAIEDNEVVLSGGEKLPDSVPRTSLQELEYTIQQRKQQADTVKEGV